MRPFKELHICFKTNLVSGSSNFDELFRFGSGFVWHWHVGLVKLLLSRSLGQIRLMFLALKLDISMALGFSPLYITIYMKILKCITLRWFTSCSVINQTMV